MQGILDLQVPGLRWVSWTYRYLVYAGYPGLVGSGIWSKLDILNWMYLVYAGYPGPTGTLIYDGFPGLQAPGLRWVSLTCWYRYLV